jgi:hypothetical protein
MTASRRLGTALALSALLAASLVQAQPSAAQKETARSLMAEARELRERGDLEGAFSRFSAADTIMGVPTTGFEMAATQAALGKLVEARETLRRVLALPQSPDDPEPFNEARAKARALDQRLQSRIAALHFMVTGVAASETLVVTVDGEVVPVAVLGMPFRVNPGRHVVVARAGGREAKSEVVALESRTLKVELPLPAPQTDAAVPSHVQLDETPAPAPAASTATPKAPPAASSAGVPLVAYVAGGVGVAGILVGGVTGMMAVSHKNAAARDCVDGQCPPSTWDDLDSARSMAAVSTAGFVVGAVGLAIGTSFLLLHDEPTTARAVTPKARISRLSVTPDLGPRGGSLSVSGRF